MLIGLFLELPGGQLTVLLGPEHGLRGFVKDQIELEDEIDRQTGLPLCSLYGPTRIPAPR